jgi:hypothetical protein
MRKKGGPEFECLWFSLVATVSATNKMHNHNITAILLLLK